MDWKDFFRLTVFKETLQGTHPYFEERLKISEEFSLEEVTLSAFESLQLTVAEKKLFSLNARKIFLRHSYFRSHEFFRISENFADKVSQEKEQILTFSTGGGGIYLFLGLSKHLKDKKVICYTSELPLNVVQINQEFRKDIHLILRPHSRSYFKNFPTLWQQSPLIDLYEISEA